MFGGCLGEVLLVVFPFMGDVGEFFAVGFLGDFDESVND